MYPLESFRLLFIILNRDICLMLMIFVCEAYIVEHM